MKLETIRWRVSLIKYLLEIQNSVRFWKIREMLEKNMAITRILRLRAFLYRPSSFGEVKGQAELNGQTWLNLNVLAELSMSIQNAIKIMQKKNKQFSYLTGD